MPLAWDMRGMRYDAELLYNPHKLIFILPDDALGLFDLHFTHVYIVKIRSLCMLNLNPEQLFPCVLRLAQEKKGLLYIMALECMNMF